MPDEQQKGQPKPDAQPQQPKNAPVDPKASITPRLIKASKYNSFKDLLRRQDGSKPDAD